MNTKEYIKSQLPPKETKEIPPDSFPCQICGDPIVINPNSKHSAYYIEIPKVDDEMNTSIGHLMICKYCFSRIAIEIENEIENIKQNLD